MFVSRPFHPVAVCLFCPLIPSADAFLSVRLFAFRTQEELRVREEDQQTITVEVELKKHDSEPVISVSQPTPEPRYAPKKTPSI